MELLNFPDKSTSTAMLKYGFGSKYSSLFFLWHAHVLADFKVLCVQPKKQTSIGTCLLPTWQVGIELQLLSDGKPDVIFVHRQTEKKGVLRHTSCRLLGARVLVSILFRFLHSLLLLSHTFLPTFPLFHLFPTFVSFSTIYLFIYLFIYAVAQLVEALRYKSEGRGFDSRWCNWNFLLA